MTLAAHPAGDGNTADPDREWQLRAARGDITTDGALEYVRNARQFRHTWAQRDPELAQALDDGDALYPDDDRRWPDIVAPPEYDPDTTAIDDLIAASDPIGGMFVDWHEFFTRDRDDADDWTIDDVLARGRGHSIFAKGKTGKSELVLRLVVDHVTDPTNTDVAIVFDYEMGDADLYHRLVEQFGYDEHSDFTRLHYAQLPAIPPLDTPGGADTIDLTITWVKEQHPDAHIIVIIDTIGRAVEGDENANDTILRFYRHTGTVLRRHAVTWARLDHTGHEHSDRARGGSAKLDDIDVAWELKRTDDGTALMRRASRLSWVPESVTFIRHSNPTVTYTRTQSGMYLDGTADIARLLEQLKVPVTHGRGLARKALKDAGHTCGNELLASAIRYRKSEAYINRKLSMDRSEQSGWTGQMDRSDDNPVTRVDSSVDSRGQVPADPVDRCVHLEGGHLSGPTPNGTDPRIDTEDW